jgi:hypothetical protein
MWRRNPARLELRSTNWDDDDDDDDDDDAALVAISRDMCMKNPGVTIFSCKLASCLLASCPFSFL